MINICGVLELFIMLFHFYLFIPSRKITTSTLSRQKRKQLTAFIGFAGLADVIYHLSELGINETNGENRNNLKCRQIKLLQSASNSEKLAYWKNEKIKAKSRIKSERQHAKKF